MKKTRLAQAMEYIDDDLISKAAVSTGTRKSRFWICMGSIAAMLFLCIGLGAAYWGSGSKPAEVSSVITLDVNPSISLAVDAGETVIRAEGLNDDGKIVLDEMKLEGVDLDVAVNAIIGSMLQKGYLNDLQNTVLVSVENNDTAKSAELQERIAAVIQSAFQSENLDGAVLSQAIQETDDLEQLAQRYNISLGKAALIQEVLSLDSTLTAEELAPLSITEIALISQSRDLAAEAFMQNGTVSNKAYIQQAEALKIAYNYANVSTADVKEMEVELDSDNGTIIYEIEFRTETAKYECCIDARSGQVLRFEAKQQTGSAPSSQESHNESEHSSTSSVQFIGENAAKEAALSNAGLSVSDVKYINAWMEYEDGCPVYYEVEFGVVNTEYTYQIDLYSGAVLAQWTDTDEHHSSKSSQTASNVIGEEAAKAAAYSDAGVLSSQVQKCKAEYDYRGDSSSVYEIHFQTAQYEYEYTIDAITGAILESERHD